MIMPPRVRKFALLAHVTASVGWIGAAAVVLALGILGLLSENPQTVRGAYLVMAPVAWTVLVPLALVSLLTGVVQALGTTWGLFRHYWVVFKLLITVLATLLLLLYMQTFTLMASLAADPETNLDTVRNSSPVLHAVGALIALLAVMVLAVYKPRGRVLTRSTRPSASRSTGPSAPSMNSNSPPCRGRTGSTRTGCTPRSATSPRTSSRTCTTVRTLPSSNRCWENPPSTKPGAI